MADWQWGVLRSDNHTTRPSGRLDVDFNVDGKFRKWSYHILHFIKARKVRNKTEGIIGSETAEDSLGLMDRRSLTRLGRPCECVC
jgi:hypothetical protein